MKRYLLIFLCFFLLASCSSTVKTNSLVGVGVGETEMETLPVTADLAVSEQKVRAEANGKVADIDILTKEALAKALSQAPPSVDGPDVLVGQHAFTEVSGKDLKVILTGYPAWYTNFRTATEADSLRLNMVSSGLSPANEPQVGGRWYDIGGDWFFSVKYTFGDGFGWGLGAGKSWPSDLVHGDIFVGLEFEEGNVLSPWKNESCPADAYDWDSNYCSLARLGGGINIGAIYGELPNDLKLVYGLSLGVWYSDYRNNYRSYYYDSSDWFNYRYVEESKDEWLITGPFVKLRWHGLELGLRLLFGVSETYTYNGSGSDNENSESIANFQFSIGYTY